MDLVFPMAVPPRKYPTPAERRATAQATNSEVKKLIDVELNATRKKTERLRALRLAKEAKDGMTELDRKTAKPKRKPRR